MKLSTAIDGFFLDRSLELAETTIANYRHYLTMFLAFVGDKEIEAITARDVNRFLAHLERKRNLSDRTIHDVRARVAILWKWASLELGINDIFPAVAKPSYRKPEIIPYTRDEVQRMMEAAEQDRQWRTKDGRQVRSKRPTALRDKAIVLTLVDTGIRSSELCALTVGDYDPQRGRLHILRGKGDKARFVVAGKRTQKALWRYLGSRPGAKKSDPLFTSGSGEAMDRGNLYHMIVRFGEHANINGATVHRFRHTFAITFLRNGGNIFELQELLGHEDIKTLTHYVKLAESDIDAAQRHSPADNWRL